MDALALLLQRVPVIVEAPFMAWGEIDRHSKGCHRRRPIDAASARRAPVDSSMSFTTL